LLSISCAGVAINACVGDTNNTAIITSDGGPSSNDGSTIGSGADGSTMMNGDAGSTPDGTTPMGDGAAADGSMGPPPASFAGLSLVDFKNQPLITTGPAGSIGFASTASVGAFTVGGMTAMPTGTGTSTELVFAKLDSTLAATLVRAYASDNTLYLAKKPAIDSNGDIYVSGWFLSTSFLGVAGHNPAGTETMGFTAKFDGKTGNLDWAQPLGTTTASEYAYCTTVAANPTPGTIAVGCYFVGHFNYLGNDGNTHTFTDAQNSYDSVILELDAGTGKAIWAKHLFGEAAFQDNDDIVYDVSFASGSRVVVSGTTSSTALTDGTFLVGNAVSADSFVLKIDNVATQPVLWGKRYKTLSDQPSVASTSSTTNYTIMCGSFAGSTDFGNGPHNTTGNSDADAYVVALDNTGAFKWLLTYGGQYGEGCKDVVVDATDHVLAQGLRGSSAITVGGIALPDPPPRGASGSVATDTIKLDSTGKVVWAKTLTSATTGAAVQGYTIAADTTSRAVVGGTFSSTVDFGNDAGVAPSGASEAFILVRNP
jgi:hypothetical protein